MNNQVKRKFKKLNIAFFALMFLIGNLIGSFTTNTAYAAGSADSNVTSFTVSPKEVADAGQVEVKIEFSEVNNRKLQKGDTIELNWTNESNLYLQGYKGKVDINDEKSGKKIGELVVEHGKATITFDDVVEKLEDVKGWAKFNLLARNLADTTEESVRTAYVYAGGRSESVNIKKSASGNESVFYYKTGRNDVNETNRLYWWLTVNLGKKHAEEDVKIEDEIQEGHALLPDSFEITIDYHDNYTKRIKGKNALNEFISQYPGSNISVNGNKIKVFIPKEHVSNNNIDIFYKTEITNSSQEWFQNNSKAWYKEWGEPKVEGGIFNHSVQKANISAGAIGTVRGDLKVTKTVDGTDIGIPGVVFELVRADGGDIRTGETKLILITDSKGIASIRGLAIGAYKLKEIDAPEWIDFEPLKAPVKEFNIKADDTKGINLGVTNKKKVISINGSKTWNDNKNQDGKRPNEIKINLFKKVGDGELAKVETKTIKEDTDGNWKWKFSNLEEYDNNGNKITYSITEDEVKGYTSKVEGYNVINTHTPKKTSVQVTKAWKDKNNQDGKRPASVTIKLLADGKEVSGKTLTLTAENNWTGTFTDLSEYKAGKKIEYTIKEEPVGNGYVGVITGSAEDGYVVTNVRTPNTPPEKPNKELPKTGDGSNIFLYALLMLTSGALLSLIGYRRRKHAK